MARPHSPPKLGNRPSESSVLVEINLDGSGVSDISTSVPFYDHMLTALSKHSLIDMTVKATGDTHIDAHHTVEDVAITFGEVLRTALGNKAGIRRFGEATVPLDEALAHAPGVPPHWWSLHRFFDPPCV
jgi:imidazoleglycerol-phosphate dehydratase